MTLTQRRFKGFTPLPRSCTFWFAWVDPISLFKDFEGSNPAKRVAVLDTYFTPPAFPQTPRVPNPFHVLRQLDCLSHHSRQKSKLNRLLSVHQNLSAYLWLAGRLPSTFLVNLTLSLIVRVAGFVRLKWRIKNNIPYCIGLLALINRLY